MDKAMEKVIRRIFRIPEGELLTIWRLPGWRGCPLGDPERGVTNCPMGFDTGKWSPNNPPAWMRERLGEEVLANCQQCRGNLRLSSQEAQAWSNVYKILAGGEK